MGKMNQCPQGSTELCVLPMRGFSPMQAPWTHAPAGIQGQFHTALKSKKIFHLQIAWMNLGDIMLFRTQIWALKS
jgi:hypothetical protein